MPNIKKSKLRKATLLFWPLVLYALAALIWWFISLELQSNAMLEYKLAQAESRLKTEHDTLAYNVEKYKATDEHRRSRVKHSGEGAVFLGLILLGAFYIYRSLRQQRRLQQHQQNFMMAVTHELKTPIAVARLNLETLIKHRLDEEKQLAIIKKTLDETKRLDFLTNNILVSSQLENRGYKANKEEIDLSSLIKDRIKEFKDRFPDRKFVEEIEEGCDVSGDAFLLQILVNNLVENALKYSGKDDPLKIILQNRPSPVLKVADSGPGVPDSEKRKIFTKFYRIGQEATRKTQGTGLGLFLCDQIAKDHRGTISVKNNLPKGSIFMVVFKNA